MFKTFKNIISHSSGLLCALFFLILTAGCGDDPISSGGSGFIKGTVQDDRTNTPLVGVTLTTAPATVSTLSDTTGFFRIIDIAEGQYSVSASKSGYVRTSVVVAVAAGETTIADFSLPLSENRIPDAPTAFDPPDGATDQATTALTLTWSGSDPDPGDTLTYDVQLFTSSGPVTKVADDQRDTTVVVSDLLFGETYFWQVIARDEDRNERHGPVLQFTTQQPPDNPIVFASKMGNNLDVYTSGSTSLDDRLSRLTRNPSAERWPRLTPDRSRIAFSSDRTGEDHIFVMNVSGGDPSQITALPVAGFNNNGIGFGWSPDGTQLIYAHYDNLYRIDATGGNLTLLATAPAGRHFREVDWSPLGDKIAALTIGSSRYDSEIYTLNSDGTNLTLLIGNNPGAMGGPSFSPDGQRILYSYDVSGFESNNGRQLDTRLFTVLQDGTGTTDLSTGKPVGTNDLNARWSPNGASIVFENAANDGSGDTSLWILEVAAPANRTRIVSEGVMPDWR